MSDKGKRLVDKINHGVGRLSPILRKLYFSLCDVFLSRHIGETITTSMRQYTKHFAIKPQGITDTINQIESAFNEIHSNTFQQYKYEFVFRSEEDDVSLVVSRVNNMAEIKSAMEIIEKDTGR